MELVCKTCIVKAGKNRNKRSYCRTAHADKRHKRENHMDKSKSELYKAAGERIKTLRRQKGCSRELMANHVKLSDKFLYEIETGKKGFSSDALLRIADFLDTGCDYIMTGRKTSVKCAEEIFCEIQILSAEQKKELARLVEFNRKPDNLE